ncbi:MAG: ribonuclease D [Methylococcaceae bacterium]|nr:ribonuclease D [Methylococcaceae bacterium]MCI0732352.1 ribonuclease D [Methylococcaceae bacterium]
MYPIDNKIEIDYIDTSSGLASLCAQVEGSDWLAVDTEFLRESTYFPRFCLLQIATTEQVACIDPLTIEDLGPLFDILYDPRSIKVFHSGRQDLEIFFNIRGSLPGPVFDTQLAAPILGFTEQISYAGLVSELLGVNLVKAHTRTDWSTRPLSRDQIQYAGNDVLYLARIYQKMRDQLSALGRSDWLSDDFAALLDPDNYRNPPDQAWQRIRGIQNLNGGALSILQSLAGWREQNAYRSNIPRNWIVKDDVLLDIARLKPSRVDELGSLRGLNERALRRYGKKICEVVEKARSNPPIEPEIKSKLVKKSPEQEVLISLLSGVVHQLALEHSLSAPTLAPRKEIEQLVSGNPDSKLLHGWRKAIVGERLHAILGGELAISIQNGVIHLEPRPPHRIPMERNGSSR